jgi:hypothetical protein
MILHVAIAAYGVGNIILGELLKEHVERLAQNVRQHAEASAVGHAKHDLFHANLRAVFDDGIECGDHRFASFE